MPKIFIDGVPHEAGEGQNLLQAVLSLGFDLPYFCWHPALHSVGACRQCAVKQFKDEHDTKGRIVMACMTPASEGARISIDDAEVKAFRANIIEWLMTNHPHDCPVCDEGGECHLQDMTLMSGHNYRRFRFQKRTFTNQYLGPFINHEMNRCITCYRCVRFYNDYAGGKDLGAFAIRNLVYFGRHEQGVLENEFSGNLIEVCPTGVFTDKTFKRHFTRKWDLQTSPSICHACSLGCNITPGERYGVVRRVRNRYHHEINGYFLCDRGRFGYEFVNGERRTRRGYVHAFDKKNETTILPYEEALEKLKALVKASKRIVTIGSARASVESNFAMQTLGASGLFSNGMTRTETGLVKKIRDILGSPHMKAASIRDIEEADAVIVLGEDLTNTAPRMALAVRQAARRRGIKESAALGVPEWNDAAVRELAQSPKGQVYLAQVSKTKLDEVADRVVYGVPDEIARFGFAAAHAIAPGAPDVNGLPEDAVKAVREIALALAKAEHPVVIAGVSQRSEAIIEAAANLARALAQGGGKPASIAFALAECNSMCSAYIEGTPLDDVLASPKGSSPDLLIICENDLYRHMSRARVDELLGSAAHVVVLDHSETMTTEKAELVLPCASFAEGSGTLINNEGRAQRFFGVFLPDDGGMQESWRWISSALSALDAERKRRWNTLDEVIDSLTAEVPSLAPIVESAPGSDFRVEGLKIPRETPGFSGRTAMHAHQTVHEQKPPEDIDSPLSFSMEGYPGQPPPALRSFVWAPGWNSVQATSKYQTEVGGPLLGGEPGVKLIKPKTSGSVEYFTSIPSSFVKREPQYLTVFLYHIFGSEEMSVRSPGINEQMPHPYWALNRDDALRHALKEGTLLTLALEDGEHRELPVKIVDGLPSGAIGVPWGLPEGVRVQSPVWIEIEKE